MLVVLLVPGDLGAKAKRKTIDDLLAIVPNPPVVPEDMVSALAEGLPGGEYRSRRGLIGRCAS